MKALLCRWFPHRFAYLYPGGYRCRRCGEPGFWVPSRDE